MTVLDARIINTKYGMETYLDMVNSVEIIELRSPTDNNPFFEILLGIEFFLLKEQKYYDSTKGYFWISMSTDFQTIKLKETDTESLFAIKSNVEREATKELIGDWLINTYSFKQAIAELFDQNKAVYQTEKEATDCLGTKQFLENLLRLKTEDIQNASVEQYTKDAPFFRYEIVG